MDRFDWLTWGAASDTVTVVSIGQQIRLRYPFVLAGSDSLFVNGALMPRTAYAIDYQRGMVRISGPLPDNARVRVNYTHLPVMLKSVYALRELSIADAGEPAPVAKSDALERGETSALQRDPGQQLNFGGMKSISFSVGTNQGVSLDQTLKATVTGNITPTIRVKALLSDENLPIQPEGNTEELEYLDKVFVEIESDRAKVSLGDFSFTNDFSTFSPFTREVKGVSGEVALKGSRVFLAGASTKGVFRSIVFRGTEGLQGPYELLSQIRVTPEVIIAGTERVYLDGELLQRGRNRDYTIDYDRGTVTFTPHRLITADSELSVDFEATQEKYDRSAVFAGAEHLSLPGKLTFQTAYARERDDASQPKSISLDDDERAIIEQAGDDPARASASGITEVAPGEGEYIRVPADTISVIAEQYVFNDSTGNYRLIFTEVGSNRGEYVLDGISRKGLPVYRFAGSKRGSYSIGKRLPLPDSQELFTFRLGRAKNERFSFDLEYNLSNYDRNILSAEGDGDNVGDAGAFSVSARNLSLGPGAVGFKAQLSTIDESFKSFDNARPSYFYRDWNLEQDKLAGREILGEASTSYEWGKNFKADYSYGGIDRNVFAGRKQEGNVKLEAAADRTLAARIFTSEVEGNGETRTRTHQSYSLQTGVWKVIPNASFTDEEFLRSAPAASDSGIAFQRATVGISSRRGQQLTYSLSFENRKTEELADTTGGWIDSRTNRTVALSMATRASSSMQGEVQVTHREEENYIFNDSRSSDLARLKAVLKLADLGLRSDLDYEVSQNQKRTLQKNVILVGEGRGDYNALGEPVGQGRGAYMLVYLPTADLVPTHTVDLTFRFSIGGGMLASAPVGSGVWPWIKRNVSLDQTVSVREETTYDEAWKVYLLVPSALQRDNSTLSGITSIRQDWSLLSGYTNSSLSYRFERIDEEDNLFQGTSEERFVLQHALKLDHSFSKIFTGTTEIKRDERNRRGTGLPVGTGSAYTVKGWSLAGGGGVRFSAGSTIDGLVEVSTRRDDISLFEERQITLKPRFVLRVMKIASLFGSYEFARTLEITGTGVKPIFFAGEGNTHRWNASANVSLSKSISLVTTYQGRSEKSFTGKNIVEHNLKVETRAFF